MNKNGVAKLLYLLVLASLFLLSCTHEIEVAEITFPDNQEILFTVLSQESIETVCFTSAKAWTAAVTCDGDSSWCTLSALEGEAGDRQIVITATANTADDDREAIITIKSDKVEKPIFLSQSKVAKITISEEQKSQILASVACGETVNFTSSRAWRVEVTGEGDTSWCTLSILNGDAGDGEITIAATANETDVDRVATVIIKSEGEEETITVIQSKGGIALTNPDDSNITLDLESAIRTIKFFSSVAWTVAVTGEADMAWCTVSQPVGEAGACEIDITISNNNGFEDRVATITIKSSEVGKDSEEVIKITQKDLEAEITLAEGHENISFTSVASSKTVNFISARPWTVEVTGRDAYWYTITAKTGESGGDSNFLVSAGINETFSEKEAIITIKSEEVEEAITLIQHDIAALITIDGGQTNFDFPPAGGSKIIKFNSTKPWRAALSQGAEQWFTLSSVSGDEGDKEITIRATAANETSDVRNYSITISSEDNESETIALNQNIDVVSFTDENFKLYLTGNRLINTNGDDVISKFEAKEFNGEINLGAGTNVVSVEGIEYFTNLTSFDTSYDSNNNIVILDLSKNTALTHIYYRGDWDKLTLTTLDISGCRALTHLTLRYSKLTSLEIKDLPALTDLDCSDNGLKSLNISNLPALTDLDCSDNGLKSLNISTFPALTSLKVKSNGVTSLNLVSNSLETLDCSWSWSLTSIDISNLPALRELNCSVSDLKSLNLKSSTLERLDCSSCELTVLNISSLPALTDLNCNSNNLSSINLSNHKSLSKLSAGWNNNLRSADLSGCTALTNVILFYLKTVNFSGCTALLDIWLPNSPLTALDLSSCTALEKLDFDGTLMNSIDLRNNQKLTNLNCDRNANLKTINLKTGQTIKNLVKGSHTKLVYYD